MGARKMVVAAVGPLGCIPFQLAFRFSRNGECSEKVNAEVRELNVGLLAMLNQLNAELPGSRFVYADAYKGVAELVANPSLAGKNESIISPLVLILFQIQTQTQWFRFG